MSSKINNFAKLFFLVSMAGLLAYAILAFYSLHIAFSSTFQVRTYHEQTKSTDLSDLQDTIIDINLKYILWWTIDEDKQRDIVPYRSALPIENINPIGEGRNPFINHNCLNTNCFLTTDKELINGDYKNFDALVLNLALLRKWKKNDIPQKRNRKQKYVFYGMRPSTDVLVCNAEADQYFNWTWSFRLNSDIFNPFFEVKDARGNVVAPSDNVKWPINVTDLPAVDTQNSLQKTKALAWIINKCNTKLDRMKYAIALQKEMKIQKLVFDIFGCDYLQCPIEGCLETIRRDYYFYLAYEDGVEKDYLTHEVLTGYKQYAVPIVISGANLTKFLPANSYINARHTAADILAANIDYIIRNPKTYHGFHRWRTQFTFHEVDPHRGICDLCAFLNNKDLVKTEGHTSRFRSWWHPGKLSERCFPKTAEDLYHVISYMNNTRGL